MFKLMGKKLFSILRLFFLSKRMKGERGREGERERRRERERERREREREREKEREGEREGEREETSSYIWKYDTFVTHSWGSLKYDNGLI